MINFQWVFLRFIVIVDSSAGNISVAATLPCHCNVHCHLHGTPSRVVYGYGLNLVKNFLRERLSSAENKVIRSWDFIRKVATLQHPTEYSFKQELHAVNNIIRVFAWKFNYVIARIHSSFFSFKRNICSKQYKLFAVASPQTVAHFVVNTANTKKCCVLCPAGCIEICATLSNKIHHLSNQIQGKYDHTLCVCVHCAAGLGLVDARICTSSVFIFMMDVYDWIGAHSIKMMFGKLYENDWRRTSSHFIASNTI